jgi:SNF2 family DNA or RNA helicase
LEVAKYVIHFDHWWNPARMWQAEDRAYRITSDETVNVYIIQSNK